MMWLIYLGLIAACIIARRDRAGLIIASFLVVQATEFAMGWLIGATSNSTRELMARLSFWVVPFIILNVGAILGSAFGKHDE